jgi:hypothetical protein
VAISYISNSVVDFAEAGSGSVSVTIPSDAEIVLVYVNHYEGGTVYAFPNPTTTLGGQNCTQLQECSDTENNNQGCLEYIKTSVSGTGSKTFTWDDGSRLLTNGIGGALLVYVKGINTTTPIKDSGKNETGDDVTGLTAASGDMIFGFTSSDSSTTVTGDSQISIYNDTMDGAAYTGAAYEESEGDYYSTGAYPCACAVVLAVAAASNPTVTISETLSFAEALD